MESLDRYFEKCIKDAYMSEQREYIPEKATWWYVVVENQLIFSINTPYAKVERRARYRIHRNISRNFGFGDNGCYYISPVVDYNFMCNKFRVGNKDYYLCKSDEIEQGRLIGSSKMEKFYSTYFDIPEDQLTSHMIDDLHLPRYMDWDKFRALYFDAFSRYPETIIQHKSDNVVFY